MNRAFNQEKFFNQTKRLTGLVFLFCIHDAFSSLFSIIFSRYHLYVKQPEAKASSASYLKTFSAKLWFFSLLAFVILALSLWLTSNFLNRSYRAEPRVSLPSCFLAIVSGFINQGIRCDVRDDENVKAGGNYFAYYNNRKFLRINVFVMGVVETVMNA